MVGGATNQQPHASQLPPPPSSSLTTEEDEFLKRNTDCVYFLASPLTCKKGSECEYRHSDIARVNPRDCWYWLNGNCLNPKCGFRHPPLDGLLGAEVTTPVGPAVPQAPAAPAPYAKQSVACIFFQKGFCLKGHLCPFLHGPPTMVNNNKAAQPVAPNPSKIASNATEKSIQEQKFTQETGQKQVEFLPPHGKPAARVQPHAPARNGGGAVEKKVALAVAPPVEQPPRYRPENVVLPPVVNHVSDNEGNMNGKEVEEYSREPTPGFDVLVDDELGESEYYPNEEQQFGRSRGHDFDMVRSADYDVDRDMYSEHQRDYDHYNGEGYAWEDRRESSERSANFGRKRYPRDESPDQFDKSDLRHQISKQRRGNNNNNNNYNNTHSSVGGGLRSVVSREEPLRDSHHHHHNHQQHRLDTNSLSSRLRGRIKIPGRSISPGNVNESRVEREIDMGRHRSRYSPGRPPYVSSNHNRFRERIRSRAGDDYSNEGRDYRSSRGRRDGGSDNDSEFTGPKRLSELKTGRIEADDRQGKRKYAQHSQEKSSFEGPKPLSEILKRKRGNTNEDKNNSKEVKENNEKERGTVNAENEKSTKIDEDANLDQELEAYEHRDGEYDYDHDHDQMDGEDYNLEEGEEYIEEEEEAGDDENGKKEKEVYS